MSKPLYRLAERLVLASAGLSIPLFLASIGLSIVDPGNDILIQGRVLFDLPFYVSYWLLVLGCAVGGLGLLSSVWRMTQREGW